MSSPDVTLVTPYPPLGTRHAGSSGVASYSANLARHLTDEGAVVTVVAEELPGEPPMSWDGPVRVERRYRPGPAALPTACRAAAATRAPVVHVQHETFLYGGMTSVPGAVPALMSLRRAGRETVVTLHQVVAPETIDRSFTRMHRVPVPGSVARVGLTGLQRALQTAASAVIVHERRFAELLPGAALIAHGVEPASPLDRSEARAQLGLDERFVVLCFGFVAPYKGLEHALDGARRAGSPTLLVVAGGAHPRMTRERYDERLRRRYEDVARFTGYVPEKDVARWFSGADLALLPYPRPHASSGALALALAYGTPVLLSPLLARTTGAPPETAVALDPDAIGARLRALAADPASRRPLADATRALASGRAWPAVARRHLELYERLAHGHGSARRVVRQAQSW